MDLTPASLAALCDAALPAERLTADELEVICFGEDDEVIGDAHAAAAFTVKRHAGLAAAWLLLVAVDPARQGRGLGKALVADVVERARAADCFDLHLGNAIPRYVWPGVDLFDTRAGGFFEGLGFVEGPLAVNMAIDTAFRRGPPSGIVVERETGDGAVDLARSAYPHWEDEVTRGIGKGTTFSARGADGETIAFGCHSVNRYGQIGPMATAPDLKHGGIGSAVLAAVCADLEAAGEETGEISWVSNLRFYGKCGARVCRVFRGGRLRLEPLL